MVTMASADSALKNYYLGAVSQQLNTAVNPFLAKIRQSTADVWGKEVRRLAQYGVNGGIGAGTEDGDLPSAAGNNYEQCITTLKNLYGTLEISDKAVRASENSAGAFVNLLNAEMEGLVSSAKANFSRMLYGDGNGYVGAISKTDDSGIYVDNIGRLYEGMYIDIRSNSAVVEGGENIQVTSVNYGGGYITLSKEVTGTLVGKYVYVHGAYGNELTGFKAIFGTGDIYGLSRSGESYLTPASFSVTTLTEAAIAEKIGYMEEYFNNRPNMILCSFKTRAKIAELLSASRMQVNTAVLEGGFTAITFDGIPVVADRYCDDGSIYLVNTEDFCIAQLCDWAWLEDEDGKILKQIPGKAAYSATLVKYAELICKKPCAQGVITGF